MNSNPSQTAAAATVETALADRITALELFAQQLVLVLSAQGRLNERALTRWMALTRERMQDTGSATPGEVQAHAQLQRLLEE